jgi:hypothetical protein
MAGSLNSKEFGAADSSPALHKVFSPLAQAQPMKYDVSGQEKRYRDVPWTDGSRAVSKMKKEAWRGETYIPDAAEGTYGYGRQAMNSTF